MTKPEMNRKWWLKIPKMTTRTGLSPSRARSSVGLTNLDVRSIQDTTTHPTLHVFLASLDDADKGSKRPEMTWRDGAMNGAEYGARDES